MKPGSVGTLMLTFSLKERMLDKPAHYRIVSVEECDRRLTYWAEEASQRIAFAAALMEGLRP